MDIILTLLNTNSDFRRTNVPLSIPLVVHAIAGAGKTHILTTLLERCTDCCVHTLGQPILRSSNHRGSGGPRRSLNVLDEYQLAASFEGYEVLFGDPLQGPADKEYPEAHYINSKSKRYGQQTCTLLNHIGIQCTSTRADSVSVRHPFGATPIGTVIVLDSEAADYLTAHSVRSKRVCEVLGQTYPVTTVLLTKRFAEYSRRELYIAFTRHRYQLLILSPYAASRT
uniref:TGB1 n=1 Tax=Agave potexvirus 1 TaxID=2794411 RepID=A0A7T5QZC0_9VIRU|nr:TGB1 [Agave potexvirus 1]